MNNDRSNKENCQCLIKWISLVFIVALSIIVYTFRDWFVAIPLGLVLLVIWINVYYSSFLHYLYLIRIPFIGGFILVSFPFIANRTPASKLLQNLFVMESGIQLIAVMVFATLTSLMIKSMIRNIMIWKEPSLYKKENNLLFIFILLPTLLFLFLELDYNYKNYWFLISVVSCVIVWLLWWGIEKSFRLENLIEKIEETKTAHEKTINLSKDFKELKW